MTGGEFNALISFKVNDKSKLRKIKGALEVSLGAGTLPGLSLQAKAEVNLGETNNKSDHETTVSVSWCGGSDIKDDSITEWTVPSLKKAAIEFADRVGLFPNIEN